ncbi:MAG: helix-turn-helix domain-containing protein [Enterobacteriaceae bacterium]|jgi:transcriptional regulator with XRE-family HTH domain|nr:helix-turn-helix domain-containing protein [Enterobacteriaceae bacterium]
MKDVNVLVGKRIQDRRKELGITATTLAKQIGISQQQLSRYERGTNRINVTHLVAICRKLETTITWFFLDCFEEDNKKGAVNKLETQYVPMAETIIGKNGC